MKLYTAEQVKFGEQAAAKRVGVDLYQLMERAGAASYALIKRNYSNINNIVVLCGRGNNGGDGYIVARLASADGVQVQLVQVEPQRPLKGDAATAQQRFVEAGGTIIDAETWLDEQQGLKASLVVDALLGTGLKGAVEGVMAKLIAQVNKLSTEVFSLDIPSGLIADTGYVMGPCIHANRTLTFVAPKLGQFTGQANNYIGELEFADLGIGDEFAKLCNSVIYCVTPTQLNNHLPQRKPTAHKGNVGKVLCCGGNEGMGGAIMLTGKAAHRTGAGMVATLTHHSNANAVLGFHPECMVRSWEGDKSLVEARLDWCDVVAIGPGLGQHDWWSRTLFSLVLKQLNEQHQHKSFVIDADGLSMLVDFPRPTPKQVLTPHPGEAATLLGCSVKEVEQDRLSACQKLHQRYGGVILLKGSGTVIYDGVQWHIIKAGHEGMASAGMGDVLTGIIAGLLAQGMSPMDSATTAALIHGFAAEKMSESGIKIGLLASDLLTQIAKIVSSKALSE